MVQLLLTTILRRACAVHIMQKIAHNSRHSTLPIPTTFFCDVHNSHKQVVGLICTKQKLFCVRPVVSLLRATKSYRVSRPLESPNQTKG